jgi:hypothetical protein
MSDAVQPEVPPGRPQQEGIQVGGPPRDAVQPEVPAPGRVRRKRSAQGQEAMSAGCVTLGIGIFVLFMVVVYVVGRSAGVEQRVDEVNRRLERIETKLDELGNKLAAEKR